MSSNQFETSNMRWYVFLVTLYKFPAPLPQKKKYIQQFLNVYYSKALDQRRGVIKY